MYSFDFSLIQTCLGQPLLLAGLERLSYSRSPMRSSQSPTAVPMGSAFCSSPKAPSTKSGAAPAPCADTVMRKVSSKRERFGPNHTNGKRQRRLKLQLFKLGCLSTAFGNVLPCLWCRGKGALTTPNANNNDFSLRTLTKNSYAPWSSAGVECGVCVDDKYSLKLFPGKCTNSPLKNFHRAPWAASALPGMGWGWKKICELKIRIS